MHRVDNQYAVAILPATEDIGPNPNGYFVKNTRVSQSYINSLQEEYCSLIEGADLVLAKGDKTQLKQAFTKLISDATTAVGITAIEEDINPHLGGDLDTLIWSIISESSGDIQITSNGTGKVLLNADDVLVKEYIKHRGDLNNYIRIAGDHIRLKANTTGMVTLGAFGLSLDYGSADLISDDQFFTDPNYSTLPTQRACKFYTNTTIYSIPGINAQVINTSIQLATYTSGAQVYNVWGNIHKLNITIATHTILEPGRINYLMGGGNWAVGDINICTSIVITLKKNNINTSLNITLGRNILFASTFSATHIDVVAGDVLSFEVNKNNSILSGGDTYKLIALALRFAKSYA